MSFAPVRRCSARDRPPRSFSAPVLSDDDGQAASSPSPRKSAPGGTGDDRDHGYTSDESPPPSPPTVVDLTVPGAARMRVPGARHPRAFTPATRRVYARRERAYDRAVPGVVLERIDTMSEEPAGTANPDERYGRAQQQDPARARALAHLATAYAITAYTHAALNIALTAVAAWAAVAFARALAGDISRKTRARAGRLALDAAECARDMVRNDCAGMAHRPHSPAIELLCHQWETCVQRGDYARTDALSGTVWAETLAETVNAFSSQISSGTAIVVCILALTFLLAFSTAAFGYIHHKLVDKRLTSSDMATEPQSQMVRRPTNGFEDGMWEEVLPDTPRAPATYIRTPGRATPLIHQGYAGAITAPRNRFGRQ
jgi:hypothetical protein